MSCTMPSAEQASPLPFLYHAAPPAKQFSELACDFPLFQALLGPSDTLAGHSSNLRSAALTTAGGGSVSWSMRLGNSALGPPPGFTAMALSFSRTPGSAIARRAASSSFFTIDGGVLTETNTPLQSPMSTSG